MPLNNCTLDETFQDSTSVLNRLINRLMAGSIIHQKVGVYRVEAEEIGTIGRDDMDRHRDRTNA